MREDKIVQGSRAGVCIKVTRTNPTNLNT